MEEQVIADRYHVRSRIGAGGAAQVYLATDRVLGRDAALKVLHPETAADPLFVERFRRVSQLVSWTEMDEPTAFFVYGTLKRGQLNSPLIMPRARFIERAHVRGELFDVGLFPALVDGEGVVYGEIIYLDAGDMPRLLGVIDRLEDFRPESPRTSMYLRRIVEVTTESKNRVPAYAYFYNCEHPLLPRPAALTHLSNGLWPGAEKPAIEAGPVLSAFQQHVRTYCETAWAEQDSGYDWRRAPD